MATRPPTALPILDIQHDFQDVLADARESKFPSGSGAQEKFWISAYQTGKDSVHGKGWAVSPTPGAPGPAISSTQGRGNWSIGTSGEFVLSDANDGESWYKASCPTLDIRDVRCRIPRMALKCPQLPSSSTTSPSNDMELDGSNGVHKSDSTQPGQGLGTSLKIPAFDLSPDGRQFATGHENGSVNVYSVPIPPRPSHRVGDFLQTSQSSPAPSARLKPHLASITTLRFFPSSTVLLTGSDDCTLCVVSADPPPSPTSSRPFASSHSDALLPGTGAARVFKGHRRPITDTAIISRGRNVLSASKDGSVRLWDCVSGNQIRMIAPEGGGVNKLALGAVDLASFYPSGAGSATERKLWVAPTEVDTQDKLVFCAMQNGSANLIDLGTKNVVRKILYLPSRPLAASSLPEGAKSLTAISYSPDSYLLATGSGGGVISLFDIRALGSSDNSSDSAGLLGRYQRNEAAIEDVAFTSGHKLAVVTFDGLPFVLSPSSGGEWKVEEELLGYDCDPSRVVKWSSSESGTPEIWTAGDDGIVRRY